MAKSSRFGTRLQRREAVEGYLWISPWVLGFIIFSLGPIIASFYLSLTKYKIGGTPVWIGFANYKEAFSGDKLFWPSLGRTAYFSIASVVLGVILSLLAAMLLNQNIKGRNIFRALFYLPSLTPIVALAILWGWLLNPKLGLVNYLLAQIGIQGPGWLVDQVWAVPSIILISLYFFLIFVHTMMTVNYLKVNQTFYIIVVIIDWIYFVAMIIYTGIMLHYLRMRYSHLYKQSIFNALF